MAEATAHGLGDSAGERLPNDNAAAACKRRDGLAAGGLRKHRGGSVNGERAVGGAKKKKKNFLTLHAFRDFKINKYIFP